MKFGVVTHAVGHHMSFEKTLDTIKQIGFDSILLLTNRNADAVNPDGTSKSPFPNVLDSDPEHVRKAVCDAGLEIASLHFSGRIDIESDTGLETTIAALKEYAAYALALECKFLTHPVPSCGRSKVPTAEKSGEIKRLAMCMNTVAETFMKAGLRMGVDIHHCAWVEGLDDCRLLLDSMPCENAGILLNIGHMTSAEGYGWLLVDEYPDRIPVVGWKDHTLAKDRPRPMWSIELGTGHSPFELYIRAFKGNPADRAHFINCENVPDDVRIPVLKRSREYLMRLWDEVR
ncbi:MAG: sugar phosphate isomerase/epimerase [Candidatus Poribacteria bacterium]|nr:sugar phosphate isomerase/epimerase [Candidatus Poribacteria bacterium]